MPQGGYQIRSEVRCQLGEGPMYSAREDAVYWVDILAPAVHRLSLADGTQSTWPMPERIGWLVEREHRSGFIAGLQSGFTELTLEPLSLRTLVDPEPHRPGNRMNDCCVDAAGRLWAGTMDADETEAIGSLYRLDADLAVSRHDDGYRVTNGPAISLDGRTLYHNDTARRRIYAFDLGKGGDIGNRRLFLEFDEQQGYPDGMTVDAEDHLWIAHWGGARVSRFKPDGTYVRSISLPATQVTSCVFAGAGLERMFVTSAATGRDDEPDAGKLFEVDPGVRGVMQPRFAG